MSGPQDPQNPKKETNKKIEDLYDYARDNKRDTGAYIILILGLVFMFFWQTFFIGSLMVGCVAGLYFSNEFMMMIQDRNQLIYANGTVRSLVFVGTMVAFLIAAPGLFLGTAIMTGIKELLKTQK